jgi:hypothetical protein
MSQSSEFCRLNPLCCFSTSVYCYWCLLRHRLSPETFGYTYLSILDGNSWYVLETCSFIRGTCWDQLLYTCSFPSKYLILILVHFPSRKLIFVEEFTFCPLDVLPCPQQGACIKQIVVFKKVLSGVLFQNMVTQSHLRQKTLYPSKRPYIWRNIYLKLREPLKLINNHMIHLCLEYTIKDFFEWTWIFTLFGSLFKSGAI